LKAKKIETKKIEIFVLIALAVFLGAFYFVKPIITGYVPGVNMTIEIQSLNLTIDSSYNYVLASANETLLCLRSLRMSGKVLGEGRVEIAIDSEKGDRYLVYENVKKKVRLPTIGFPITGLTTKENEEKGTWLVVQPLEPQHPLYPIYGEEEETFRELESNEKIVSGIFDNKCVKTCEIAQGLFNGTYYLLTFKVEPGTVLQIDEIAYTTY